MREEVDESAQPLDLAGTIRTDGIRVPAPMREDTTGNNQPLDRAWTTPKRCVANVVPAPRLELQSGSLNDLRSILCELAKNAKLEMKRGNSGAVEELLQIFIESGEKFSTFEKKFVENDRGLQPFARHSKGLPFVAEGSQ